MPGEELERRSVKHTETRKKTEAQRGDKHHVYCPVKYTTVIYPSEAEKVINLYDVTTGVYISGLVRNLMY